MREPEGFREFVDTRSPALLRAAWLLTGDWHSAEDLVQTALAKTWPKWRTILRRDAPEVYVRRVMLTTFLSWRRRRSSSEMPIAEVQHSGIAEDGHLADLRMDLQRALAELSPQQRAVVVLRYFEELTVAETAAALGCSQGTVKSQTSKALASLRSVLDDTHRASLADQGASTW